jgi:hypothetical protein
MTRMRVNTHQDSHSQTNGYSGFSKLVLWKVEGVYHSQICPFNEMSKLAFKRLTLKFSIAYFMKWATQFCSFHEMGNKFSCFMKWAILLRISWNDQNSAYFMKHAISRITCNICTDGWPPLGCTAGQAKDDNDHEWHNVSVMRDFNNDIITWGRWGNAGLRKIKVTTPPSPLW